MDSYDDGENISDYMNYPYKYLSLISTDDLEVGVAHGEDEYHVDYIHISDLQEFRDLHDFIQVC